MAFSITSFSFSPTKSEAVKKRHHSPDPIFPNSSIPFSFFGVFGTLITIAPSSLQISTVLSDDSLS